MKQNKSSESHNRKGAKAAKSLVTAGFPPGEIEAARPTGKAAGKTAFCSANPAQMSWREMRRWLRAEADVIAKHAPAQIHSLHD